MLSDLPPDLVQLGPRFQVDVDGLAADAPRQIPLRPMAPVTGLRAGAVRLAALAPHRVQRPPPEVACLRDQGEQLSAAAFEPCHVTPGEVSHASLLN
jgi:hypothetical protein